MRTNLKDIEEKIKPLGNRLSYDKEFIFDLMAAYGRAASNITRLRNGQLNIADDKQTEIAQKNVVYFKPANKDLYTVIDDLKSSPTVVRYSTRFVIVTDFQQLLAIDTKTNETLDIAIRDINKHYAFFLPWAGMEKAQFITENHADVKAAEKMAKLFDILIAHNGYTTALEWHNLTTFFTRLLFCFFAEDTNIFSKSQFSRAVGSYTQEDGSDLKDFLKILFASLDDSDKEGYPSHLKAFPYVNGELFKDFSAIPEFNKEARTLLLKSGSELDWSNINPDIFGSMFQAVVRPGERTGLGQHYTSVPNIMKTIEPLFLDELKAEFDKSYDDLSKLDKLLNRISGIKIFDPACGSGNFLIIAYKELRRLEHAVLERQAELRPHQMAMLGSRINIENFYGIEIDDFAHEVAILSLWLAKHQMNIEFTEKFGLELPLIPLKESGNIIRGNATNIIWENVCPNSGNEEIYLIGNPPYSGFKKQTSEQKKDMARVFYGRKDYKKLDYISCWFHFASLYIENSKAEAALVSTNSVCQGEHIGLLWPGILRNKLEISFAHKSFRWTNNARHNAGVTCIIVGLRNKSNKPRVLIDGMFSSEVANINPYLSDGPNIIVSKRSRPISGLPKMTLGNMPKDDGNLLLSKAEVLEITSAYPESDKFIRPVIGAKEFLNSLNKWCIWILAKDLEQALSIPPIKQRIEKVKRFRELSSDKSANSMAKTPFMFREQNMANKHAIIVPTVTSEKREYIPMGVIDNKTIVVAPNNVIYDPDFFVFSVIASRMHMVWVRAVAGQLETRIRYSSTLCYNTFPLPVLLPKEKDALTQCAYSILDIRESHPGMTLAELYDPKKMPTDLAEAHTNLDRVIERYYRAKPFENDDERLAYLFGLYEQMSAREKETS